MAGLTYYPAVRISQPDWAAELIDAMSLIPGGGRVVVADVAVDAEADNRKRIMSGSIYGRTFAERDAGLGFGPWATGDEEVHIVAFTVGDAALEPEIELLRHGTLVKENRLPDWATLSAPLKAIIRGKYHCITSN